jgi:large subunit ribosomal protein L15
MKLNEIKDNWGATQYKTRVGRGIGCTKGKTCGRGVKGQKSRTGVSNMGEGGQTPIFRRLPKRGFKNINRVTMEVVNFEVLEKFVESKKLDAAKINRETLTKAGIVKTNAPLKLLAKGAVKSKFNIEVDYASESAKAAVEKAGGKLTLKAPAKAAA